jgi:hypothetical protein
VGRVGRKVGKWRGVTGESRLQDPRWDMGTCVASPPKVPFVRILIYSLHPHSPSNYISNNLYHLDYPTLEHLYLSFFPQASP